MTRASLDPSSTPARRRHALSALGAIGALGAMTMAACGGGGSSSSNSSNAALAGLSLSAGSLSPAFAGDTLGYTASVANGVASFTVSPTAADSGAVIRVNGSVVSSGSASASIALAVGNNTVTIVVSAADGSSTRTYTLVVTRAAATASSDASLSALTLSSGTLSPAFAAATTSYTVAIASTVTAITVSATTSSAAATLKINGNTVASGSSSGSISLPVGLSTITLTVTAEDGSTRSYSVLATRASAGTCTITPQETQGPYPLLAILSNSAMVRTDIRESKTGVPLTLTLTILDQSDGCGPVAGAAVYIWHCDKDGLYSGYDASNNAGQAGLTYLRGIALTDSNGQVTFTTIYPGWYAGRVTHIHFQVYLNNNLAVTATATSQLAFPPEVTTAVYNSALYSKGQNTSVTSFAADNVFSDGTTYQLASVSGSVANGYAASLAVTIA